MKKTIFTIGTALFIAAAGFSANPSFPENILLSQTEATEDDVTKTEDGTADSAATTEEASFSVLIQPSDMLAQESENSDDGNTEDLPSDESSFVPVIHTGILIAQTTDEESKKSDEGTTDEEIPADNVSFAPAESMEYMLAQVSAEESEAKDTGAEDEDTEGNSSFVPASNAGWLIAQASEEEVPADDDSTAGADKTTES